jgi:hypothetical protein
MICLLLWGGPLLLGLIDEAPHPFPDLWLWLLMTCCAIGLLALVAFDRARRPVQLVAGLILAIWVFRLLPALLYVA